MSPFHSLSEYEQLVYTLQQQYPSITRSTLVIGRRGRGSAHLSGELLFTSGHRLNLQRHHELQRKDDNLLNELQIFLKRSLAVSLTLPLQTLNAKFTQGMKIGKL